MFSAFSNWSSATDELFAYLTCKLGLLSHSLAALMLLWWSVLELSIVVCDACKNHCVNGLEDRYITDWYRQVQTCTVKVDRSDLSIEWDLCSKACNVNIVWYTFREHSMATFRLEKLEGIFKCYFLPVDFWARSDFKKNVFRKFYICDTCKRETYFSSGSLWRFFQTTTQILIATHTDQFIKNQTWYEILQLSE